MYKRSISVLGTKGGVGKTTISHLLAQGLARFGIRTIMMTTDHTAGRKVLSDAKRRYNTFNAQTTLQMQYGFNAFANIEVGSGNAVMLIDGGGNRIETDNVIAKYSDIILLPFRDSEEDIRVVTEDMKRLPEAYALPSAWPTNNFASASADKVLLKMEAEFPRRILSPVPVCRATQQLLREDFVGVDSSVTTIAKNLVFDVLSKLDINPHEQ